MKNTSPPFELSVFVPTIIITALIGFGFVFASDFMTAITAEARAMVTTNWGWLYLLFGLASLVYCLWLSLGRYGNIKLGGADEEPEFSTVHWVSMMFTAGIGAGLVTWAFGEPIYYLQTPPLGIEPFSDQAYEWAHMYPFMHWGFIPWAFYAITSVPIAYNLYVLKKPYMRISEACDGALPERGKPALKSIIDIFIIIGIIAGTTTSLGIGVPLLSALVAELTGVADNFMLKFAVLLLWVLIFGTSTVRGLKRGIQMLADINMALVGILLLILLFVGPTIFILNMSTNSLGLMLDNFFSIILWTDPVTGSTFPLDWTVFYWAWWLAFAAFVGLFIARISRGRTIKQVILGTILWGSLGTIGYLAIAGGYALHLQKTGVLDLAQILSETDLYTLTARIAGQMPFGSLTLTFFLIVCLIFYATTMDSAAYIVASISSKEIALNQDPLLSLRIIWVGILFLMALGTIISDSLDTVMSITVIGSLPLLPIVVLMCVSLNRQLARDYPLVNNGPKRG